MVELVKPAQHGFLDQNAERADDERRTREAAKNSVEAYVYATREKLSAAEDEEAESPDAHTLVDVTTAEQREALKEALADAADWLYGDGEATDTETYRARLRALKDLGEPPFARLEELRARGRMIKDAKTFITASRTTVEGWAETHPQITANETADATAAIDEFDAWFTPKLAAQQALAGHEEPVLTRAAVAIKVRPISDLLTRLGRKPKPTPTPAPEADDGLFADEADADDDEAMFRSPLKPSANPAADGDDETGGEKDEAGGDGAPAPSAKSASATKAPAGAKAKSASATATAKKATPTANKPKAAAKSASATATKAPAGAKSKSASATATPKKATPTASKAAGSSKTPEKQKAKRDEL